MLKKIDGNSPIYKIIKFFFGDTVQLYIALIMMSIMYHYRSSLTAVYGAAAVVAAAILFRLFDYIAKHKLIGTAAYLGTLTAFLFAVKLCVDEGARTYPLSFGIWFLTPQDALDYSKWYTLAMFLLFMIFMTSVIYYFTKVRYRIFVNFLIFIIPFALYGKEYEKMPTAFIMLLAIGYIVIMIQCRQISDTDRIRVVNKRTMWAASAVYIVVFASIAAIVPKPEIEADREILETLISAEDFTDRLMEALNVFQDATTGDQFRNSIDETPLYFVRAEEPLKLKTLTFSTYDYATDSWSVTENDTRYKISSTENEITAPQTGELLRAILSAAELDDEFSEEYGLKNLSADSITIPEIKNIFIQTVNSAAQFAPVPSAMTRLTDTSSDKPIAKIRSGLIYCTDGRFAYNENFQYEYSADTFFMDSQNKAIADMMSVDDYENLLWDAYLAYVNSFDSQSDEALLLYDEYNLLEYQDAYLDYGGNEQIYNLAREITDGLESDYDKARAIENYFAVNGFVYDLNYRKENGENVIDFLYNSKRGVCYEYATAMVLIARAAGIPTRYCEGYSMSELYVNERLETNYVVKSRDAHGFPEVYIRGVGWISFEPTVSTMASDNSGKKAVDKLSQAGIFLLASALIFLLCVKAYPSVSHKLLLMRLKKANAGDSAIMIMRRICRIYKLDSSLTSQEAAEYILKLSGCDISEAARLFDRAVYGGEELSDIEKDNIINIYVSAYEANREMKRRKNKKPETA